MVILFWLSFSVAIAGTYIALHGGPFTLCRVVVLCALGTAMGVLVIIGSLEAILGIPLLGCAVLVVALTEVDPPS